MQSFVKCRITCTLDPCWTWEYVLGKHSAWHIQGPVIKDKVWGTWKRI